MNPIHKSIIKLNSNFYFKSIKPAYFLNDILAKLISIIIQSAPDTGRKGAGLGTVEGARQGGRIQINKSHAAARAYGPRGA